MLNQPGMQANTEYWFRLLYECIFGSCYNNVDVSQFLAWLSHVWLWITVIGYALAVIGLLVIIYCTMRIFELRAREEEYYHTLITEPTAEESTNHRWQHIQMLAESGKSSEWREAIIEADIMLDDLLTKEGYHGASVGEKLKGVDRANFSTLDDAWEAHKVRNRIAHDGSAFDLSDTLVHRTIARYEAVFREFELI